MKSYAVEFKLRHWKGEEFVNETCIYHTSAKNKIEAINKTINYFTTSQQFAHSFSKVTIEQ